MANRYGRTPVEIMEDSQRDLNATVYRVAAAARNREAQRIASGRDASAESVVARLALTQHVRG